MTFEENMSRSKEVLGAYFRHGLHELGSVFYGHGTAAQHPEYGMMGTRLPSQIAEGMSGEPNPSADKEIAPPSGLDAYLKQAEERSEAAREPERDDRDHERE